MEPTEVKIVFLHGLESNPNGSKAQFLRKHFPQTYAPHMNRPFVLHHSLQVATKALQQQQPHLVIGSSYGSAVAMLLMQFEIWRGPTVLLAPAIGNIFPIGRLWLPKDIAACTLVHGSQDNVCPIAISRKIQKRNPFVRLIEVNDGHRLQSSMIDQQQLLPIIQETLAQAQQHALATNDYVCATDWQQLRHRVNFTLAGLCMLNIHNLLFQLPYKIWRSRWKHR